MADAMRMVCCMGLAGFADKESLWSIFFCESACAMPSG